MGGNHVKEHVIELEWADRHLARDCAQDALGIRRFGANRWPILRRRIRLLEVAPTLADLSGAPGRLHALHANRSGDYEMSLWGSTRLILRPVRTHLLLGSGGIDPATVKVVLIVEITDYHGK